MRWVVRRGGVGAIGGHRSGMTGAFASHVVQAIAVAMLAGGLVWLVWLYSSGLRDPRYFDGWVLAGGMGLQLYFHIARKRNRQSPRSALRWRKFHILLGFLLIAAFILHSDFSWPDTAFEWALWTGFVLVALSGVLGTYLAWWLKAKPGLGEGLSYDLIPARRAEMARALHLAVGQSEQPAAAIDLPAPPYDAWILDLHAVHLRDFFEGPRNSAAHLFGSQRPLERLTMEVDNLSLYVDQKSKEKLAAIRDMVIEKDRLDFAHVHLGLSRAWLFVHVPVTYALIVLTLVHIVVVYAFSAGLW